jgi:hypothetical protein
MHSGQLQGSRGKLLLGSSSLSACASAPGVLNLFRVKRDSFSSPSSLTSPYPKYHLLKIQVPIAAASNKNPDTSTTDYLDRGNLLKTLEGDLRKERLSDTLLFWCESLKPRYGRR